MLNCEFGEGRDSADLCPSADGQHVHQPRDGLQGDAFGFKSCVCARRTCSPYTNAEARLKCGDHVSHRSARGAVA
eukprot:4018269-Amphidinium_carterae.2